MTKVFLTSCTQKNDDDFISLPISKSLTKLNRIYSYSEHILLTNHIVTENTRGLGICYNEALIEARSLKNDIGIFVHDDCYILDSFVIEKLEEGFKKFDVIGVAGSTKFELKSPVCWHNSPRETWAGSVEHPATNGKDNDGFYTSAFGVTPKRVAVIDGLFIAMNLNTCKDLKFRENYGFHFYDLALSLDANKMGLKVGVINIHTSHLSHGGYNTDSWRIAEQQFINDYKKC